MPGAGSSVAVMNVTGRLSAAAGSGLAAIFHTLGRLRHGPRALHPRGRVAHATVRITGGPALGVPLVDEPAEHPGTVRMSRAVGLPAPLPDVLGIALRIEPAGGGPVDLLFATTGTGAVGRHLLVPRREVVHGAFTTLLPLRSRQGPVVFGLFPIGPGRFELASALVGKPWVARGEVEIGQLVDDDPALRFDPVDQIPVGLIEYGVVRRLRASSYAPSSDPDLAEPPEGR